MYRLDVDGTLEPLSDALPHFPNGCAVTPDREHPWMVESRVPTVKRLDLTTGTVEQLTRLDGTVADGIAFTNDGGVVVSCYRPHVIMHIDRDESVDRVAEDPQGTLLAAPTNIVFACERGDQLISAKLGHWHLALVESGLRGLPLHYPDRWAADA